MEEKGQEAHRKKTRKSNSLAFKLQVVKEIEKGDYI